MHRTFREHVKRRTAYLDGLWEFRTDPRDEGIRDEWYRQFPAPERRMAVPSCWNNDIGLYDYEGAAWYRTWFELPAAAHIRLVFHGVLGQADIYLDGQQVASHYGGFTPFDAVVPDAAAGRHELVVRADNTHSERTLPLERVDWFHYGGIIRPVELQLLPDVYIEEAAADYRLDIGTRCAELDVRIRWRSLGDAPAAVRYGAALGGRRLGSGGFMLDPGTRREAVVRCRLQDLELWEPDAPALYYLSIESEDDDLIDRIGFRHIETRDSAVYLNGKPLYMRGVNRHEEHPDWGFAFPARLMLKDLDILRDLGCNAVRGSHYPQSKLWVDLLDENGIVFWSELPIWQFGASHMADGLVRERALRMLEEMIRRDRHSPSVLFWSVHNECDTDTEAGFEFTRLLTERARQLDASRLIAFATHKAMTDRCYPLVDVIGVNKYYGWYDGDVEDFTGFLTELASYVDEAGGAGKPVFMAEFGGAGIFGDVGWEERRLFSENCQARILERALEQFRASPLISGAFVWQFADIRSDVPRFRDRARGFNNKGLVNEYRKPKRAYEEVRRTYRSWRAQESASEPHSETDKIDKNE